MDIPDDRLFKGSPGQAGPRIHRTGQKTDGKPDNIDAVVLIGSDKGGVVKPTVSVNLALAVSKKQRESAPSNTAMDHVTARRLREVREWPSPGGKRGPRQRRRLPPPGPFA